MYVDLWGRSAPDALYPFLRLDPKIAVHLNVHSICVTSPYVPAAVPFTVENLALSVETLSPEEMNHLLVTILGPCAQLKVLTVNVASLDHNSVGFLLQCPRLEELVLEGRTAASIRSFLDELLLVASSPPVSLPAVERLRRLRLRVSNVSWPGRWLLGSPAYASRSTRVDDVQLMAVIPKLLGLFPSLDYLQHPYEQLPDAVWKGIRALSRRSLRFWTCNTMMNQQCLRYDDQVTKVIHDLVHGVLFSVLSNFYE